MTDISDHEATYNAEMLEQCRKGYEEGANAALLQALRICARADLVMPEWAARGYIKAWDTFRLARAKTLDEAFGVSWPKGKHLSATRKQIMNDLGVLMRVEELNESGMPIDDQLFRKVGKELGLGKTLTSDYYYSAKAFYRRSDNSGKI